ncbi:MAG: hypothetical protein HC911_11040 [Chloroflexaceae bacterium]|nr:hypothetical protein [Chloroflexaceae bacterium]
MRSRCPLNVLSLGMVLLFVACGQSYTASQSPLPPQPQPSIPPTLPTRTDLPAQGEWLLLNATIRTANNGREQGYLVYELQADAFSRWQPDVTQFTATALPSDFPPPARTVILPDPDFSQPRLLVVAQDGRYMVVQPDLPAASGTALRRALAVDPSQTQVLLVAHADAGDALYVFDLQRGVATPIWSIDPADRNANTPLEAAWLPDETGVVFATGREVITLSRDGADVRVLAEDEQYSTTQFVGVDPTGVVAIVAIEDQLIQQIALADGTSTDLDGLLSVSDQYARYALAQPTAVQGVLLEERGPGSAGTLTLLPFGGGGATVLHTFAKDTPLLARAPQPEGWERYLRPDAAPAVLLGAPDGRSVALLGAAGDDCFAEATPPVNVKPWVYEARCQYGLYRFALEQRTLTPLGSYRFWDARPLLWMEA